MPKAKLTQKEMTDSERREVKTLLDRTRKAHGRPLTNGESNRIKDEFIARLTAEREAAAKQARAAKKAGPETRYFGHLSMVGPDAQPREALTRSVFCQTAML
ncbi:hypothetical protein SODG_002091 [Sodalis praecaptivus]